MRTTALGAFIALLTLSTAVNAQGYAPLPPSYAPAPAPTPAPPGVQSQNFDQYPSYLEMTSALQDGTQVVLRCGYTQSGTTSMADPGYMEMTVLNQGNGTYMRYQRIDNKLIMTVPVPGGVGRFLLEVVEPTGMVIAKSCQNNSANDTISGCTPGQPFMPAPQAMAQDQNASNQCGALLNKVTPQLDHFTYSAPKTQIFKNALRQKVGVLEAP